MLKIVKFGTKIVAIKLFATALNHFQNICIYWISISWNVKIGLFTINENKILLIKKKGYVYSGFFFCFEV